MTNEEKALSIAESTVSERTSSLPANQIQKIIVRDACIEMAAWKQEDMIKKAVKWLKKMIPSSNLERKIYNCFTEEQKHNLIEDFKKAMKGE